MRGDGCQSRSARVLEERVEPGARAPDVARLRLYLELKLTCGPPATPPLRSTPATLRTEFGVTGQCSAAAGALRGCDRLAALLAKARTGRIGGPALRAHCRRRNGSRRLIQPRRTISAMPARVMPAAVMAAAMRHTANEPFEKTHAYPPLRWKTPRYSTPGRKWNPVGPPRAPPGSSDEQAHTADPIIGIRMEGTNAPRTRHDASE